MMVRVSEHTEGTMTQNEKHRLLPAAAALPKDGVSLVEKITPPAGVAEVLQLLAYCNRIQAGFPSVSPFAKIWITNSSHTV